MTTNVTLELTIGIPSSVVLYSVLGYGGAFSGGVKCHPKPVVDLDTPGASSITVPTLEWALTHQYPEADALTVPGKPDWFRSLRSGAQPTASKALARTSANLEVQFAQLSGASHAVKFVVVGANPLLSLAPAIDAEIAVGFRRTGAAIEYTVQGKHDGFPNYTLIIDGKTVYAWDCVANSEDPSALGPPMDQSITVGWKFL